MTGPMLRHYHSRMSLGQIPIQNLGVVNCQAAKIHCKALYKARDTIHRVVLDKVFGFKYNQICQTCTMT